MKHLPECDLLGYVDVHLGVFGFDNHYGDAGLILYDARPPIGLPVLSEVPVQVQGGRLAHSCQGLIASPDGKVEGLGFSYRVKLVLSLEAGLGAYLE